MADASAAVTTTTVPGIYTLTVESVANGCRGLDTVEIVDDRVAPVADADYVNVYGDDITAQREADRQNEENVARLEKAVGDMEDKLRDAAQ